MRELDITRLIGARRGGGREEEEEEEESGGNSGSAVFCPNDTVRLFARQSTQRETKRERERAKRTGEEGRERREEATETHFLFGLQYHFYKPPAIEFHSIQFAILPISHSNSP